MTKESKHNYIFQLITLVLAIFLTVVIFTFIMHDGSNTWISGKLVDYETHDENTTIYIKALAIHNFTINDLGGYNLDNYIGKEIEIYCYSEYGYIKINKIIDVKK